MKPVPLAGFAKPKDELLPAMVGSLDATHKSGVSGAKTRLRQSQRLLAWKSQETFPENSAVRKTTLNESSSVNFSATQLNSVQTHVYVCCSRMGTGSEVGAGVFGGMVVGGALVVTGGIVIHGSSVGHESSEGATKAGSSLASWISSNPTVKPVVKNRASKTS